MKENNSSKKILLIGGGSGMGKATALYLAEKNNQVIISGRRKEKLDEVASLSSRIYARQADITDRDSTSRLFNWYQNKFGDLDVLINAAGINIANRTLKEISPEEWDKVIRINLTGSFNCLTEALKIMRGKKSGLIIMINSVAGKRATPLAGVAYNASKFGMHALTVSAAEEERENGIRITNIYPGEVNTPILEERHSPPSAEHRSKILQPDDIAKVINHLITLPERVHIPELIIKPNQQSYI